MQNDRLNWTVPSIKKISNEKKRWKGQPTSSLDTHERWINLSRCCRHDRVFSSLLVTYHKKKKIPLAFSLLLLSSSKEKETKWLSLYGGLDFPVAAFPLSALIKILDVNLANGQSFVCDNRTNNSPAFAETTLIINTVVVVVVEYIL